MDAVDGVDGRTMLHSAVLAEAVWITGNVRDRNGKVPLWCALQHRDAAGAVVAEGGLLCRHPWVKAHCSVVVTVRGEYLEGVDTSPSGVCGAGVRAVYMQPFTEVDARTYIERANTAWEKEHKEDVEKRGPETRENVQSSCVRRTLGTCTAAEPVCAAHGVPRTVQREGF